MPDGRGALLKAPRNVVCDMNVPPLLYSLGTVLLFLLRILRSRILQRPGQPAGVQLLGVVCAGHDVFAGVGVVRVWPAGGRIQDQQRPDARYCGMGLLVFTVAKLFLHDLWRLGGIYRIGSLIGLAVVLIVVSFIYQRFLSQPRAQSASAQ